MMTLNTSTLVKWYGLAVLIIIVDQLSKYYVSSNFVYGSPLVITDFFNFTLLHNTGAAFSFLSDAGGWQRWFFTVIAIVVSIIIVVWIYRVGNENPTESLALALVLGGAIGNVIDRIVFGYVIDFIVLHYEDNYWPAFNIADSAICVGAVLLLIEGIRNPDGDSQDSSAK